MVNINLFLLINEPLKLLLILSELHKKLWSCNTVLKHLSNLVFHIWPPDIQMFSIFKHFFQKNYLVVCPESIFIVIILNSLKTFLVVNSLTKLIKFHGLAKFWVFVYNLLNFLKL